MFSVPLAASLCRNLANTRAISACERCSNKLFASAKFIAPSSMKSRSMCATHGTELGSPLRAARSGTDSQRQLSRSDAGWGGSRRQNGRPTNRNRIQGQCGGATRHGTGTPDIPSTIRSLDGWLRRKLRCVRLKHCKQPAGLRRFLCQHGVSSRPARELASSGRG